MVQLNKKLLLKIILSSALLAWIIFYKIDLSTLSTTIGRLKINWLIIAFLMHFSGLYFSAWRWKRILQGQNIHIDLIVLCESYLICSFFNLFMPTRIGGDAVRIHHLNQEIKSLTRSASSIFFERLIGICVLCIFSLISSFVGILLGNELPVTWIGLITGLLGICFCLCLVYTNIIRFMLSLLPINNKIKKLRRGWDDFLINIREISSDSSSVLWAVMISIFLQLNVIIHFWCIGKALSLDVPLLDYFFLIPVQMIVLMLPSINGIGLREVSSIALFDFYGINATTAAMFGFIDLAMMVLVGILGWLCFLKEGKLIPDLKSEV